MHRLLWIWFGFWVAEQTVALRRRMQLQHLPRERIEGELKKALLKAERPSVFLRCCGRWISWIAGSCFPHQ
ncbi:MAG: hypothetical protein IJN20_06065 [Oscillospiraceae bacterium]|nr:hypothetical protein [Oscillospiraceae bacterium]